MAALGIASVIGLVHRDVGHGRVVCGCWTWRLASLVSTPACPFAALGTVWSRVGRWRGVVFDFTTRRYGDVENMIAKVVAGSSSASSVKSKLESSMCGSEVADFDRLVVIPTSGLQ